MSVFSRLTDESIFTNWSASSRKLAPMAGALWPTSKTGWHRRQTILSSRGKMLSEMQQLISDLKWSRQRWPRQWSVCQQLTLVRSLKRLDRENVHLTADHSEIPRSRNPSNKSSVPRFSRAFDARFATAEPGQTDSLMEHKTKASARTDRIQKPWSVNSSYCQPGQWTSGAVANEQAIVSPKCSNGEQISMETEWQNWFIIVVRIPYFDIFV